jgi:putative transposase
LPVPVSPRIRTEKVVPATVLTCYPHAITVDNGSEFISREMDGWAYRNGVALDFIRPGRPVENCFIESFNGRPRDECLNVEVFHSLDHARAKPLEWKLDYNERRPRGSLDDLTPSEFAAKHRQKQPPEAKILNSKMVHFQGSGHTPSGLSD